MLFRNKDQENKERNPVLLGDDPDAAWLQKHNSARYFVEHPHIAWVLLIAVMVWGVWAWMAMPQRKDPEIPVRSAAVVTPWSGASAAYVEERISRRIEEAIGGNKWVERIESVSRTGLSVVTLHLHERVEETDTVLDDIALRLQSVTSLPDGAGPMVYVKDFGDTATLMLSVASPLVDDIELGIRAHAVMNALQKSQVSQSATDDSVLTMWLAPSTMSTESLRLLGTQLASQYTAHGFMGSRIVVESGLLLVITDTKHSGDLQLTRQPTQQAIQEATHQATQEAIQQALHDFYAEQKSAGALHAELWEPVALTLDKDFSNNPESLSCITEALISVRGQRYAWRDLERYTERIRAQMERLESVGRVTRWGVQTEAIFVDWSQERLASLGLSPTNVAEILAARNTSLAGGQLESGGKGVMLSPEGELRSAQDVGNVLVSRSQSGAPLYLRDVATISQAYVTPVANVNHLSYRDAMGAWQEGRAITLAIEMRSGEHIEQFSKQVDELLASLRQTLPDDLLMVRTSDQPQQVNEKISLFTLSLQEAILLVVAVAFIGFREWRSALLMATSIPLTLAMTFGMMQALGVDLQQISIASLILALGLLVDDPVVAGDAIKREIAHGRDRKTAAWLGPTKLARAILYATITNIVAYVPFLILTGDKGRFMYSMPIVVACSLVASRVVSMSFVPFLGSYILDAGRRELPLEERRKHGIGKLYYAVGGWAIDHRWKVFVASFALIAVGMWVQGQLKPQFFPKDKSHLSFVDIWLPEDATVEASQQMAHRAAAIVTAEVDAFDREHGREQGRQEGRQEGRERSADDVSADSNNASHTEHQASLMAISQFAGGGGPRFWFSITPELRQANYAQLLLEVSDGDVTKALVPRIQAALDRHLVGALADVRELETGPPIGVPVQIRIFGDDMEALRTVAGDVRGLLQGLAEARRVRDNWGSDAFAAHMHIDADKAALSGVTMLDVARILEAATSGTTVTAVRDGRLITPVILRLRPEERLHATDVEDMYVVGSQNAVPLSQISSVTYDLEPARIFRRNQQRCIVISCFTADGVLPSEIIAAIKPDLDRIEKAMPFGFRMELGGEHEEQIKGFKELAGIMGISVALIYLALLFQFGNAMKPFIVFAAIPYGIMGAFISLRITGQPFGFIAFLGIASLIGVIVSHIIVLFDFIEERREEGEDLRTALLDAGIVRLRPVVITVASTVMALFPLAIHGGVLWEPLCYAQAGGLTIATFVTLLMVPVFYAIAVLDLKLVK
ncbi:MAG: efflux RND transporter permease subunit [Pseudomonadota bacterium]